MGFRTTDLLDAHPALEACDAGLAHYGGVRRFQGEVTTVRCFEDNSRVRELLKSPGQGRVLVIDGGGSRRCALVGDLLAAAGHENGWAGIVVAGCVRDSAALAALPIGVLALGLQPRRSEKHDQGVVGVPVEILGARVVPGAFAYADEDGVVFSQQRLTD
ncbi:MAG: ribonuclease E activity regulator RraA [Proteobacteria bacterium]|nr:ribonuclease E activity regulator RraA [Pseudomonadota bacterium]